MDSNTRAFKILNSLKGPDKKNELLNNSKKPDSSESFQPKEYNVNETEDDGIPGSSISDAIRDKQSCNENTPEKILSPSEESTDSGDDSTYIPSSDSEVSVESAIVDIQHNIVIGNTLSGENSLAHYGFQHETETTTCKKNKNNCFFCEDKVLNFARHVIRNHQNETDVQKLLSFPKGSKDRKELLNLLRKKGNYLENCENGKPIRKHVDTDYLPCTYCLGFYSSKNLWRHRKTCKENPNLSSNGSKKGDQNLLFKNLRIDPTLQENVFPRMRSDRVSMIAKKDPLICAFAARYIKIHRERHFINVASRKMRELSKLLIELRKMNVEIKNLFDALRPNHYDLLIAATKIVAKYDTQKEFFESPTYAINIGTTLKQCCDIAIMQILKRKNVFGTISVAESEEELKSTIRLIEAHWKFDISSQASNDLNVKKWNKISLVPLASDLKLLKEYLIEIANQGITGLNRDKNSINSYMKLLESIFCRTILLNRKRPGELQRFFLHTYEESLLKESKHTYEEFSEAVSEVEQFMIKNFKRVVIPGKRGRGVPVLFSKDVQEHIKILLKNRENILMKPNLYLFGHPKTGEPICGHKIIKKYALASGTKNPDAITCTKLRKHLATLTQLFNLTDNDMEQLATFMGHTLGVHRSSYRLPDDVYQTAKISKLLILMEKGEAGQFKGKTLDEIDINLEEDLMAAPDNEEQLEDLPVSSNENMDISTSIAVIGNASTSSHCNTTTIKTNKRVLVPWTSEQKKIVLEYFKKHIKSKRPPKRKECDELKELHKDLLKNKDWLKIKVFVQNIY